VYTGPSPRSLGLSVLLHGAAIAALMTVSLPAPTPPEPKPDAASPTEIRIAGKLYYVSEISGSQSGASAGREAGKIRAPRAARAGKSPAPRAAPRRTEAASAAPVPSPTPTVEPAPGPAQEQPRAPRQQARAFIPPTVRPNPRATQTIIQPLSPPDLTPPPTALPNFRILADLDQMRKIPKPFVAPGRRTPPTPPQDPTLTVPALELTPVPPAPVGDPLAVLALSNRPIPFNDKVVVPPGNIAQPSGGGGASGTGTATGGGTPASSTPGTGSGTGTSASANASGSGNGGSSDAAGAPGGKGNSASGGANSANGSGNGRSTVGSGTGSALTGGTADGDKLAVVGGGGVGLPGALGNGSGAAGSGSGAGGTGSGAGRAMAGSTVINNSPTGTFDAIVVQSSPVDQYPESRGMLSGRPIYSVYISAGTSREWTLFFCVPGQKPEAVNGPVVTLGPSAPPVEAPYPTKLIRPAITLPSWEKYVLVHGMVNPQGRFEGLKLVRPIKPETDQALLAALAGWEFRAATRDGVPIAVEFLLSIPAKGL
jgi:hypothetical protein